jgi:uncharacterized protein (TIGR03086 family)
MATEALEQSFATAHGILANVTPDQYGLPTPCASWDVRGVANHMVQGVHWFGMCVEAGSNPDPDPTEGVDYAAGDLLAAFDEGARRTVTAFSAPGAQERTITLPFGELPGAMFMEIATSDIFVHSWDLARATGQPAELDSALAERLLASAQGYISDDFRGEEGVALFTAAVEVPDSAPAVERLAAFLGRTP